MDHELTTDQVKDIIDQLYSAGVMEVAFSGGEILCRKDWKEIIAYTASLATWPIILNTNGLLWTEADLQFVKQFPQVRLAISSDGYSPETYARLRKLPSGQDAETEFRKLVQMIQRAQSVGVKFNINIMITQQTVDFFFETIRFYQELGVNNFLGIKFFPSGRGLAQKDELEMPYEKWGAFLEKVIDFRQDQPTIQLGILVPCPWEMYLPLLSKGYSVQEVYQLFKYKSLLLNPNYRSMRDLGCHAGVTSCTIFPDGSMFPCSIVPATLQEWNCGNLHEQTFLEIWDSSPVFTQLRELRLQDLNGCCTECTLQQLCGGGCRARALVLKKQLTAPDPLCPLNK